MPYYRAVGEIPRKRHIQFRRPDGGLYAEELMGEEGFSSDSSLLYHVHPPTAIVKSEGVDVPAHATGVRPNHPLLPRHFKAHEIKAGGDPVLGRRLLLANDDVRISYVAADADGELYRNSVGDECVYVEAGRARLESTYGALDVGPGDYVVIPTGTIHRFVRTEPAEPLRLMVFEASGHIRPPKRYLSQYGQFLEHAPYSERDLRGPAEPLVLEGEDVPVLVRTRAGLSRLTYRHHPLDVVGWDGCLYPFVFNIADFEPIVKRTHAPPPVHQTFEGPNFVICSFCPRPLDFDDAAIPIPYNHHNVDSDEMMFYVGGDYTARRGSGIDIGSISLHPSGFTHGPAPGSVEGIIEAVRKGHKTTTETAVMIDTFRPLNIGGEALSVEASDYAWTWAR
ncbi:homogentisate 1,2-dioxygenase [Actinoallomurus vinaceus]|uniref:Homogentisate 1,2-dioxygenase n=1 Tax=Actinoallomurus vinaceus TaxID=1080074 RepID=A0ABP8UBA8_9ACTN